ncbi:MAG: hypothetical protein HPY66_1814 [Firmicutes bacterium]|nr:hypothetical protein [Bacillota bacterium]
MAYRHYCIIIYDKCNSFYIRINNFYKETVSNNIFSNLLKNSVNILKK